jgi:iron complex outermembrane receptor protein
VFNAIPRFNLTVDAYQIRIKDRILPPRCRAPVRSVLAAAGITSSAGGFYFSNSTDTRTRGLDIVGTYGGSGRSWHRQPQPVGQFQRNGVHPRRSGSGGALFGGACPDRARPSGRLYRWARRAKFIANVAWEKGPAASTCAPPAMAA